MPQVENFLGGELKLHLHPEKITIKTLASGVDFLGWVNFPDHVVIRTKTKRRMLKKAQTKGNPKSLSSYAGLLSYRNVEKVKSGLFESYLQ